jgi:hypothetical protein
MLCSAVAASNVDGAEVAAAASTRIGQGGVAKGAPIRLGMNGEVYVYEAKLVFLNVDGSVGAAPAALLTVDATARLTDDGKGALLEFRYGNPAENGPVRARFLAYVDVDLSLPRHTGGDDAFRIVGQPAASSSHQVGDADTGEVLMSFVAGELSGTAQQGSALDVVMAFSFDDTIAAGGEAMYVVEIREGPAIAQGGLQIEVSDPVLPLRVTVSARKGASSAASLEDLGPVAAVLSR